MNILGHAEDLVDMLLSNRQTGKTTVIVEGVKAYKEKYPFSPQPCVVTVNGQMAEILKRQHGVLAVPVSVVQNLRGVKAPILIEPEVFVQMIMSLTQEASILQQENEKLKRALKKFKSIMQEVEDELH